MAFLRLDIVNDEMAKHVKLGSEGLDNGSLAKISTLVDSEDGRETYAIEQLTDAKGDEYVVIAHDGHRYDERDMGGDIVVPAGSMTRAYMTHKGQTITIDKAMVDGEVAKGDLLAPKAGTFKFEKATEESVNIVAKVADKEIWAGEERYVIDLR